MAPCFYSYRLASPLNLNKVKGFTLIELVVVLILIGVLSVTIVPRMFDTNSFDARAYQVEVIAILRSAQLRAMQQTDAQFNLDPKLNEKGCHTVTVTTTQVGLADNCALVSQDEDGEYTLDELHVPRVISDNNVTFGGTFLNGSVIFDNLGRPSNCDNGCNITVNGDETLTVIIESEGFIYAP